MKHSLFGFLIVVSLIASTTAQSQPLTRRHFLSGACALVLSSGISNSANATTDKYLRLPINANTEMMGLETFGEAVAAILQNENAANEQTALRIRWHLQDAIWQQVQSQPGPFALEFGLSIWIPGNLYLNFQPKFLITPEENPQGPRTIHSIGFVSSGLNEIDYTIDSKPLTENALVLGP